MLARLRRRIETRAKRRRSATIPALRPARWGVVAVVATLLPLLTSANWAPLEPLHYQAREWQGRQLLAFDESGDGRIVEAFGDLDQARHIAVLVPGASHTLSSYLDAEPGDIERSARDLQAELRRVAPDEPSAVVAWLGYDTPFGVFDPATYRAERAAAGAPDLAKLTHWLPADARVSLVCHSYGALVCGHAATNARATDVIAIGSAGLGVDHGTELGADVGVWAARATDDPVEHVPGLQFAGFGHGVDPMSFQFGAASFTTGSIRGHSRYHEPGSESLTNIAHIVAGHYADVELEQS